MNKFIKISIIAISIFFLHGKVSSQSDWFLLNTGVSVTLQSINFPSATSGWASGYTGTIIFTSNSGNNWAVQNNGTSALLNVIRFINNSTGWAAGENGTIIKTTNGGTNWVNQISPTVQVLYSISFVNNSTGWISGYQGTILKTTNAGINWFIQNTGTYSYLRAVWFIDTSNGIATGYNGEIIRTSTGGNNWSEISYNLTSTLYCVYFINSNYGWAGGLGSQRTTNGGYNWSLMSGYGTLGIYFSDINTGWQVGFNQIYYTINSGQNWQQYNLNFGGWFFGVQFTSPTVGYICGDYGTIYKTTDGGGLFTTTINPVSNKIPDKFRLYQNYPNPFNPSTIINYQLPITNYVKLNIYDLSGKEITALVNEKQNPGTYQVEWDGKNFSSGIYYLKMQSGLFSQIKKMILLK